MFWKKKKSQKPDEASQYVLNYILDSIKDNPQACKLDQIPEGIGEFGYEITNPIPVMGVINNNSYLEKLSHESGGKITWERIGSFETSNINMPIDGYKIFVSGTELCKLYLSPYHLKTSEIAPTGFRIA